MSEIQEDLDKSTIENINIDNHANSDDLGNDSSDTASNGTNNVVKIQQAIVVTLVYILFSFVIMVAEPLKMKHMPMIVRYIYFFSPTIIFMLLQLALPMSFVRIKLRFRYELIAAVICSLLWAVYFFCFSSKNHYPLYINASITVMSNVILTAGLAAFGCMLSRIVREAKILFPIGIVAGLIDIVGAMTPVGFTNHVVQHNMKTVAKVSVKVPTYHNIPIINTIGPGDLLFIAFFFAVVIRHKMNVKGTFWFVYFALVISILAIMTPYVTQIGALAPMGAAIAISNYRYFKFTRSETFAMIYAGAIALVGALSFFLYTHYHVFNHHH